MKLKYIVPLFILLAMVTAIYARGGFFKKKTEGRSGNLIYVSMAYPSNLEGVKAFDVLTGGYVIGKLNADRLWELNLDPTHRYHIEVFYNSKQGAFNALNFAGTTKKVSSVAGQHWYRITQKPVEFLNSSSYVLYGCEATNCFE